MACSRINFTLPLNDLETVLVCQCKSRDSASVSVRVETVLVCQCKSRDSAGVSVNVRVETVLV